MSMKKTFGLAGLLLGTVFTFGAIAASATPPEETVEAQTMPRTDAGPQGTTPAPKTNPKPPGATPSLRSDAGPPGALPIK